jgi:hypothetical protein
MEPQKRFLLDDGSTVSPNELARDLHCTAPTARSRLNHSSDPKIVYRPIGERTKGFNKCKSYLLSNGKSYTAHELNAISKADITSIRCRLSGGERDFERVIRKPNKKYTSSKITERRSSPAQRIWATKPINDPMTTLWMKYA